MEKSVWNILIYAGILQVPDQPDYNSFRFLVGTYSECRFQLPIDFFFNWSKRQRVLLSQILCKLKKSSFGWRFRQFAKLIASHIKSSNFTNSKLTWDYSLFFSCVAAKCVEISCVASIPERTRLILRKSWSSLYLLLRHYYERKWKYGHSRNSREQEF